MVLGLLKRTWGMKDESNCGKCGEFAVGDAGRE
jgi:hypothetical protein